MTYQRILYLNVFWGFFINRERTKAVLNFSNFKCVGFEFRQ